MTHHSKWLDYVDCTSMLWCILRCYLIISKTSMFHSFLPWLHWLGCDSAVGPAVLPCDLSSKPLPRPGGHWKTSKTFGYCHFCWEKAAARLSLATRLLKDFSSGLAPTNVGKTDHFNLEEWQQNKNMSKFLPHVDGFHCGAENLFSKMIPTEQGRLNNPTVPSESSQTKVPWHQGLQVPCHADWAKWHFGSSSMQRPWPPQPEHFQFPTQKLGVSLGIQENASSLARHTSCAGFLRGLPSSHRHQFHCH